MKHFVLVATTLLSMTATAVAQQPGDAPGHTLIAKRTPAVAIRPKVPLPAPSPVPAPTAKPAKPAKPLEPAKPHEPAKPDKPGKKKPDQAPTPVIEPEQVPTTLSPVGTRGRRDWKFEFASVSSVRPNRGDVGTKVVIRGQHFAKDAEVQWGGQAITNAIITDEVITFTVPTAATTDMITISNGQRRPLAVGEFTIIAKADIAADNATAAKLLADRDAAAKAAWAARSRAADKAAREAELAAREAELDATREARRAAYLATQQAAFPAEFLTDPATQAELALTAKRTAALARMSRIADSLNDAKLGIRIETALLAEAERHSERMRVLEASFSVSGGVQ